MIPVSIIIPTRNEGANISHLLAGIAAALPATHQDTEIIVVDDGSTDSLARKYETTGTVADQADLP